jgi:hypothetical protein
MISIKFFDPPVFSLGRLFCFVVWAAALGVALLALEPSIAHSLLYFWTLFMSAPVFFTQSQPWTKQQKARFEKSLLNVVALGLLLSPGIIWLWGNAAAIALASVSFVAVFALCYNRFRHLRLYR